MSSSREGVYTISYQADGKIQHIRVTNTKNGGYSLGTSKTEYGVIWDLVEAHLDQRLKFKTKEGDAGVELMFPLECSSRTSRPRAVSPLARRSTWSPTTR